ncbi:Type I restriction-modification system, specificity subunit S [Acinetobacter lwoffii]|uniref:restriction endonuclease subunit S n=1 Tax=Acinetobacter lwoffii TaxID=28090 RepID=UPI001C92C770|nr:restriction endonuclease subunit S [Acinetobacter lwoffii]QZD33525.1 Type I restriction-modification system, specificity subunit S [Acinetobacter lwoffii]QZD35147.1 Type I restriction-modification system, specificity subunit S [Acinetobacter lwoffii]
MSFPTVLLSEIVDIFSGFAWKAEFFNKDYKGIPIIRIQNVGQSHNDFIYWDEPYDEKFIIHKGDLLLSLSGSFRVAIWDDKDALLNQRIVKLTPKNKYLDSKYLYYFINSIINEISNLGRNAIISNVSVADLKKTNIPLPPLAEQRRIASILDQADELRQKRQQAIEKLDQLLQATFIDIFGDPVSNPKGWDLKPVGEISESKLGKMLDKKKQSSENDQYKYLRNANVQWFKFDLSDVFEMEFNEKDRKNCELKFGDILVCEGGEPGRAAIWKNDLENCFFQKALHRVRLDMTQILPEYFVWLFWFYSKNGGFDDHITVATIAHLTGVKMKAMQIPIPPLSMQEEFQQKVNEIEVLKTTLENSSKLFESLFSSLQNQAFNGTL